MKRMTIRRAGFTLIEMLVVIAIIAVLVSLLLAALFKAKARAEDLDLKNDIVQLHNAIEAFCRDPRIGSPGFMPSKFNPNGSDAASRSYINRIFPHAGGSLNLGDVTLQGHQCLVLFLRGPNGDGWSADPRNPGTTKGGDRFGPYYDFRPERVNDIMGNGFPSFMDRFKSQPILYFSSTKWAPDRWIPNAYSNDNQLPGGVSIPPYYNVTLNPPAPNMNSFQLISAGRDKQFGTGGATWDPSFAYPMKSAGFDDVTNFKDGVMGSVK